MSTLWLCRRFGHRWEWATPSTEVCRRRSCRGVTVRRHCHRATLAAAPSRTDRGSDRA